MWAEYVVADARAGLTSVASWSAAICTVWWELAEQVGAGGLWAWSVAALVAVIDQSASIQSGRHISMRRNRMQLDAEKRQAWFNSIIKMKDQFESIFKQEFLLLLPSKVQREAFSLCQFYGTF